jgi:hypothetical protein
VKMLLLAAALVQTGPRAAGTEGRGP